MASCKLKPSSKEYKKDKNGKMTSNWSWKHYTVKNTKTEELKSFYTSPSYKRKKKIILQELKKRNVDV